MNIFIGDAYKSFVCKRYVCRRTILSTLCVCVCINWIFSDVAAVKFERNKVKTNWYIARQYSRSELALRAQGIIKKQEKKNVFARAHDDDDDAAVAYTSRSSSPRSLRRKGVENELAIKANFQNGS